MKDDDDILHAPVLYTFHNPVIVDPVEDQAAPPEVGPTGGISMGAAYLLGNPVVHLAVHQRDGSSIMVTMGMPAFAELRVAASTIFRELVEGQHSQPETRQ